MELLKARNKKNRDINKFYMVFVVIADLVEGGGCYFVGASLGTVVVVVVQKKGLNS